MSPLLPLASQTRGLTLTPLASGIISATPTYES